MKILQHRIHTIFHSILLGLICIATPQCVIAEDNVISDYPIDEYQEPRVGTAPDATVWNAIPDGLNVAWTSKYIHHSLHEVPYNTHGKCIEISAWRGERTSVQAVLYSKSDQGVLRVRMSEWKKNGVYTGINAGYARFVNYVITDDYKACGNHPMNLPTRLVPDVIDIDKPHYVHAMETRPVWCTMEIPRNIEAGEYESELQVINQTGDVITTISLKIDVKDRTLPLVCEQKFHLDLWQQPYAISRYHNVKRWSKRHIEAMRPYLEALGRAGQRTVSAILFYEPWGQQTHIPDRFEPMIEITKTSTGEWKYDYTIFDKYVELCAECGIDRQINCFSMVPWDMRFRYYDKQAKDYKYISATTSSKEYYELWHNYLKSFKTHLLKKGWFEKTHIAMDERSEADMQNAYNIAHSLGFKVALAGNYHSSLVDKLNDYCVSLEHSAFFTEAQKQNRKEMGYVTTFYTSCADREPNIYTNSLPAEATFLPIYAAANNLDGYLHWSWINWDEDPLTDSRYRMFGSGDTYCYYPGNRPSIRFELLIEGIHQYEKIVILREEYKDDSEKLALLNELLQPFTNRSIRGAECADIVTNITRFLNNVCE